MAEPVANIAPRSPLSLSSPNIIASLPMLDTASSPRSSPSDTLIWLAASTNSRIASLEVIPNRPASPARALSFSRDVRVSIFLNSSFNSSTSFLVSPVYLTTPASASSISANESTQLRAVNATPVSDASALAMIPAYLLNPSVILESERLVCCA